MRRIVTLFSLLVLIVHYGDAQDAVRSQTSNPPISLRDMAAKGDLASIKELLARGNTSKWELEAAVISAAGVEDIAPLQFLLNPGVSPNALSSAIKAVRSPKPEFPWIIQPAENGMNALMNATLAGNIEAVKLLLDRGADPNRRVVWRWAEGTGKKGLGADYTGDSMGYRWDVYIAAERGHREASPLVVAAASRQREIVEALLAKGADPEIADELGLPASAFLPFLDSPRELRGDLVIYRARRLLVGIANKPIVFVDGVQVCELASGRRFAINVPAGLHVVHLQMPSLTFGFKVRVESGKQSIVRLDVGLDSTYGHWKITPVPNVDKRVKPVDESKMTTRSLPPYIDRQPGCCFFDATIEVRTSLSATNEAVKP